MTAGEKLRMARIRRFLTQAELAEAVNVSPVSIGYYEADKRRPRYPVKQRIAAFFGVSVQSIFFDDELNTL